MTIIHVVFLHKVLQGNRVDTVGKKLSVGIKDQIILGKINNVVGRVRIGAGVKLNVIGHLRQMTHVLLHNFVSLKTKPTLAIHVRVCRLSQAPHR